MSDRRIDIAIRRRSRRGVTLIEGLISSVILALVAAGASMAISVGLGAQRDASRQLLAGLAAEQQISTAMSVPYPLVATVQGVEVVGGMLTPPRLIGVGIEVRDLMGSAFSEFGRTTVVTAQTRTFPQYNNFAVPGWRIEVTVTDSEGRVYAQIERFRCQEIEP